MNTISQAYLLSRINFCMLFIIKSMVLALYVFLNNQLFCLYWQDHQTERLLKCIISQSNMKIISQAYLLSKINLLPFIYYKINGACT